MSAAAAGPVQLRAPVLDVRAEGAYRALRLAAPPIAAAAAPGQFAALAVGGPESPMLSRRCFSLADWDTDGIEVVFSVAGRGTAWLAGRGRAEDLDVVGPLGTPFLPPAAGGRCVLVGGGYGAAPLVPLARALRAAGRTVAVVLGAATADRLLRVDAARRVAQEVHVCTDDGSAGVRGWVSGLLPGLLDGAAAVLACGPMPMLAAVAGLAQAAGVPSQVAVEEAMACGIGVCMTCVLPVRGADGRTRMVRSCLEGPVFPGDRVRFDALGTVPADAVGAAGPA